jgi:hypothetical protein
MTKRTSIILSEECAQLLTAYNSTLPAGVEMSVGKVLNELLASYLRDQLNIVSSDTQQ